MPGRVKVRILNARDLPIMDRASELTDAFVEVRFGPDIFKTEVCKKSLNPHWNSEWFKFEVQNDLLVLDYDTYSSHDTIGKVYIDLNPLLSRESPNTISGWFPIYDTMHGLRGELSIQVRVELFSDFNKFRQSSCGVQLFCSCEVPSGWRIQAMLGFIEELVVNDDPEHQWIEKIRTPRASNEARQRLFSKLSGTTTDYIQKLRIDHICMFQEYPFFTMRSFPPGFIINLGGVVSARSVKLLDKIHNPEEPQTRDAWWSELRVEIKAHATKLGCHAVLGYSENTTICDEVIILSAAGTAAKINLEHEGVSGLIGGAIGASASSTSPVGGALVNGAGGSSTQPAERGNPGGGIVGGGAATLKDTKDKHLFVDIGLANQALQKSLVSVEGHDDGPASNCSLCHIPYCPSNLPFEIQLSKCALCKKKNVPEVLFTTVDPPSDMPIWSKGSLVQARICRGRSNKNKSSEQSAREVSDTLPFIEYEVHNQLINKLKIRGLNSLFGLKIHVVLGENMIVAVGTATGAYLGPLPMPPQPVISTEVATAHDSQDLITLQKRITRTVQMHRERLNFEIVERQGDISPHSRPPTDDESDDDENDEGNFFLEKTKDKNTFVLVIDDVKDDSVSLMLHDIIPPEGFDICNTQTLPGVSADKIVGNLQMFTQMVTVKYQPQCHNSLDFSNVFNGILRRLCFKLRHCRPCSLTDVSFYVDIPDEDEINVTVTGCCLGLQDVISEPGPGLASVTTRTALGRSFESQPSSASISTTSQVEEMIFPLDGVGDQASATGSDGPQPIYQSRVGSVSGHTSKMIKRQSRIAVRPKPLKGIELTPLNKIYNGRIDRYLGYYNFFFIRESTGVREGGGIGGFLQSFILEVKAIVRAHVLALGGNALVAYNMGQSVLDDNPQKNQGQCLINVSGDVVVVCYDEDEKDPTFTDASTLIVGAA
ncbi:hypothetical protein EGW08_001049 [Elysia chlorotica]|uniref:C2 domain-containing protein n=1 Tax=Elysia chlorotica TaxID=188477 RepID=A0A3S1AG78_ELYCH|nr:hypothetical protein EGW08_001049 [Elysia chlorotica]